MNRSGTVPAEPYNDRNIIHPFTSSRKFLRLRSCGGAPHFLVLREQRGDGKGSTSNGAGRRTGSLRRINRCEAFACLNHRAGGPEDRSGDLDALRAAARCGGKFVPHVPVLAAPAILQGRWAHVGTITLGDHGPEMDSMGVVDTVQPCHVNDWFLLEHSHVICDQAERLGLLRHLLKTWQRLGKDGHVVRRGARCWFGRSIVSIRWAMRVECWKLTVLQIIP